MSRQFPPPSSARRERCGAGGITVIRVLMADDHQMVRDGFACMLARESDLRVVGTASTGREAVEFCATQACDVVIMDANMPVMNGVTATRKIAAGRNVAVVATAESADRNLVNGMLAAGATGFVLKSGAGAELARSVRSVHRGTVYLAPPIAQLLVNAYQTMGQPTPEAVVAGLLTSREMEVLQLLCEGHSGKEIARDLQLSVRTIDNYRHRLMRKLDVTSLAGLIKYAIRAGMTSLES